MLFLWCITGLVLLLIMLVGLLLGVHYVKKMFNEFTDTKPLPLPVVQMSPAEIKKLHERIDDVQGALLNPAGLTQHGVSLHDAIKAMPFPVLEIHMSNIAARELWRQHSIISSAVKATIQGLGWRSYTAGLRALAEIAHEQRGSA